MTPEQIQAHNYRINALIIVEQIKVEAMKAENAARADKGYAQAYGEESFDACWIEVKRLADSFISG